MKKHIRKKSTLAIIMNSLHVVYFMDELKYGKHTK